MLEQDKILAIFENLNKLRTNPSSFIKDFENVAKALERAGKTDESKDLFAFAKGLSKIQPMTEFVLTSNLSKVSKEKVQMILKDQKESDDEKLERLDRYISGFSDFREIYEDASDVASIIGRLIVSENDPDKKYREFLLNPILNFVGIALGEKGANNICVISFTDSLIERNSKPLADQLYNQLNLFRKFPYKAKGFLSNLNTVKSGSNEFKDELVKFMDTISESSIGEYKIHPILNELAEYVYEKNISKTFNDITDIETLTLLAKNSIHGFNKIYCYISPPGIKAAAQILITMLGNPNEVNPEIQDFSRKILNDKELKHIGIDVVGEYEIDTRVIFVAVDNFVEGTERSYLSYMEEEINRFRQTPQTYIGDLTAWRAQIDGKTYRGEAIRDVNKFIEHLKKNQEPIAKLSNHEILNKACEEYQYWAEVGKIYAEDDDILSNRLNYYISGHKKVKSLVLTGKQRPEHVITKLLVGEKDKYKKARAALLDYDYQYFGVFSSEYKGKPFVVILLVDTVYPRAFNSFEENLHFTVNLTRTNPRTLIKHVLGYKQELINKKESATQSTLTKRKQLNNKSDIVKAYEESIEFCNELNSFLLTVRTGCPLTNIEIIGIAAKSQLDNEVKIQSESDLRDYLNDFIANHFYVFEIFGKAAIPTTNDPNDFEAGEFLAKFFIESKDIEIIKKLFFFNFHKIGLSVNKEKEQASVIIVDHAVEKPQMKIPVSLRTHLQRPRFTEDELEQIRFDFKRLDIQEQGFLLPNVILSFISNSSKFLNNNPLYAEALRRVNTLENNESGINVNVLIDALSDIIKQMELPDWENFYSIYLRETGQLELNSESFKTVAKSLGFEMSDSELSDAFERILGDKEKLTKEDFVKTMMIIHKTYKADDLTSS